VLNWNLYRETSTLLLNTDATWSKKNIT